MPQLSRGSASGDSTDQSLLDRVKAQEELAWNCLVDLYGPLISNWCGRLVHSRDDRADLFQEIFLAVHRGIGGFRKQPGHSFRGWLLTITGNKVRDYFRRQKARPEVPLDPNAQIAAWESSLRELEEQEQSAAAASTKDILHRALPLLQARFTPQVWQAFWRTTIDGRPAPEVAAELNMKPDAVRQAKARVLQRLRQELRDLL
jgi:RNA polymerase sigma-70 factor, ECF subfamily